MVGIIIAMKKELAPFLAGRAYQEEVRGGKTFYTVRVADKTCVIVESGIGKVNAAYAATMLIREFDPEFVVSTGISGGLGVSPLLSLVVADKTVQHDVDTTGLGDPIGFVSTVNKIYFETDENLTNTLVAVSGGKKGTLACGDQFVSDSARSDFIVRTFNAAACDMESGAIGQVCCVAGKKYAAIRCISDGADEDAGLTFDALTDKASKILSDAVIKWIETL